jgi:DNA-binding transcriptional regulator GbsR (MarR family)
MAQDMFVESAGKLAAGFGINQFMAQLYGVLYLSDKPLSLDDLAERLKASKGNISLNIRELEKWGAVKNIWVRGSRKDYYAAEQDIRKVTANKVKTGVRKRIEQVSDMLKQFNDIVDSMGDDLTEEDKEVLRAYRGKLKKIEEMRSLVSKALAVAEKIL